MAIIQIKRRTSAGTGPIIGSNGTIKAGEPLVDLNGGNLFVSKKDKVSSSGNPLAVTDYIEYLSGANTTSLINTKISALALGSASKKNTGTTNGTVPLIGADGKLPAGVIPNVSPVTSVNSKTGAVTISLSELGGVTSTSFNSHVSNSSHLTDDQKSLIQNSYNSAIMQGDGAIYEGTKVGFDNSVVPDALVIHNAIATNYKPNKHFYYLGINKTKVLTPTSVIDGGTY